MILALILINVFFIYYASFGAFYMGLAVGRSEEPLNSWADMLAVVGIGLAWPALVLVHRRRPT